MGTPIPDSVFTKRQQIVNRAKQIRTEGLRTLNHYIDQDWLMEAFRRTRKDGAVGSDGVDSLSSESPDDTYRPSLRVDYTYTAPPGAAMLTSPDW